MKPAIWFRTASILMLLFAAGHTYGFLSFRPRSPEALAVWSAMNSVHFTESEDTFTYANFYTGFGLFVSASFCFIAALSWLLGSMAKRAPSDARLIAFFLTALQLVNIILAIKFFAIPQASFSAMSAICFLIGALSIRPTTA